MSPPDFQRSGVMLELLLILHRFHGHVHVNQIMARRVGGAKEHARTQICRRLEITETTASCTEAPMHGQGPGQRSCLTPSKTVEWLRKGGWGGGAGRGVYLAA